MPKKHKAQVYMLLHDQAKNVLIARKALMCSFWGGVEHHQASRVNGGGLHCYPGGGLEGEDIEQGALKEFAEEAGNSVDNVKRFVSSLTIRSYSSKGLPITATESPAYHVVFATVATVATVATTALQVLKASSQVNIARKMVHDRELDTVEVYPYDQAKGIFSNQYDRNIGWFHQPTLDLELIVNGMS